MKRMRFVTSSTACAMILMLLHLGCGVIAEHHVTDHQPEEYGDDRTSAPTTYDEVYDVDVEPAEEDYADTYRRSIIPGAGGHDVVQTTARVPTTDHRHSSARFSGGSCPGCGLGRLSRAQLDELHIERIKREILVKLGRASPPNVTAVRRLTLASLPRPLVWRHARPPVVLDDEEPQAIIRDNGDEDDVVMTSLWESDVGAERGGGGGRTGQVRSRYDQGNGDAAVAGSSAQDDREDDVGTQHEHDNMMSLAPPRKRKVIIFGDELKPWRGVTLNGGDCYQFALDAISHDVDVTSAHLWVYKTRDDAIPEHPPYVRNHTVAVRVPPMSTAVNSPPRNVNTTADSGGATTDDDPVRSYTSGRQTTSGSRLQLVASVGVSGTAATWVSLDVRNVVLARMRAGTPIRRRSSSQSRRAGSAGAGPAKHLQLAVECHGGCVLARGRATDTMDEERGPFLVVGTVERRRGRSGRSRRSISECADGECCKKHRLYIDFRSVDWASFIIQPRGYYINYCHGPCHLDSSADRLTGLLSMSNRYATILQDQGRVSYQSQVVPCCSATRTLTLSVMYYGDGGAIHQEDIPNMVVESCGCR